jgi:hypothetical protein
MRATVLNAGPLDDVRTSRSSNQSTPELIAKLAYPVRRRRFPQEGQAIEATPREDGINALAAVWTIVAQAY